MKTFLSILIGAALLAACEQKTETVAPAASPSSPSEAATNAAETPPAAETPIATPTPTPAESPAQKIENSLTGAPGAPTP